MAIGGIAHPIKDLQLVEDAITELHQTPLTCLSKEELSQRLMELQKLRQRLDAAVVQTTVAAEEAAVQTLTKGVRTITQYVASTTGHDPKLVGSDRALGLWLRSFPQFAAAFAAGQLTRSHLQQLKGGWRRRFHELMVRDQQLHIDNANRLDFPGFKHALAYWINAADPDGDIPNEQIAKTHLSCSTNADGSVTIKGYLDPLSAVGFKKALGHEEQKIFNNHHETGIVSTVGQRRAYALMRLISRGYKRKNGSMPEPMFDIVMSQTVAEHIIAHSGQTTTNGIPIDYYDIDGRCEAIDGTPLHPKLVAMIFGIGRFRRHIFKPDATKVDTTTVEAHRFPAWMRAVIRIEHRGQCSTPGCDAPYHWLQDDHTHPKSKGGPTATWNGTPKCGPDNRWKGNNPNRAA